MQKEIDLRKDPAVKPGDAILVTASGLQLYEEFTGTCLPWREFLSEYHVLVGLTLLN